MAIDFPASPTNGQTFIVGGVTYTFDNTKWTAVAVAGAIDAITKGNSSAEVIDTGSDGRFVVTTEGTERARVDSSGRLLVGTSSSLSNFVQGGIQLAGTGEDGFLTVSRYATSAIDSGNPGLVLARSGSGTKGTNATVVNGNDLGQIYFAGANGSSYNVGASIKATVDGVVSGGGAGDMPSRLVFSTTADGASSPTERMRISNAGRVSISDVGAVDPAFGLLEITRAQDQPDNRFHLAFHRLSNKICGMGFLDNSQTFAIQNADNNTGNGVTLAANGTSWGTTSDERKKRIGVPIENGLDKIADWRCVYFSYLNESEEVQRVGLIAQDVQQTLPEAVSVEEDEIGTLQLKYTELIPVLVKALQESKERIETLEAKVAALEGA